MKDGFFKAIFKKIRAAFLGNISSKIVTQQRMMKSAISFCQNEYLLRQGVPFAKNERYRFYQKVHELLTVYDVGGVPTAVSGRILTAAM